MASLVLFASQALDVGLEGDAFHVMSLDVGRGDVPLAVGTAHAAVLGVVLPRHVVQQLMGKVPDEVALQTPEMHMCNGHFSKDL